MRLLTDLIYRLAVGGQYVHESCKPRVKTDLSATVFSGEAEQWVRYLGMPRADRYDSPISADIRWDAASRVLEFQPRNDDSRFLTELLNDGYTQLRRKLKSKAYVLESLDQLIFANQSNRSSRLELRVSSLLPSIATREVDLRPGSEQAVVSIVLQESSVQDVERRLRRQGEGLPVDEQLGAIWSVFRRLLTRLGYPNYPRDRFFEKINVFSHSLLFSIHALYTHMSFGRLVPAPAGLVYQQIVSETTGIPDHELFDRHPYFRLLQELAALLFDESGYAANEDLVKLVVRGYLDEEYLRLSITGAMPDVTHTMASMPYRRVRGRVVTPRPQLGRYGLLNREDLRAWRKISGRLQDQGYALLGQLGAGEFGRVYDALNLDNSTLPKRVAIKVDRIVSHGLQKRILDSSNVMHIGRDLAQSPHIIRLYDAGLIRGSDYTYHVLQRVDGDTLDNLIGVTGREHASVSGPGPMRNNEMELMADYGRSVDASAREAWRRHRLALPFEEKPTLLQKTDLITSILLWLERVHQIGYVVNDLKNGNLMVSRRGQLKAIDLDAYHPIRDQLDKMQDFLFLSSSLFLFLLYLSDSVEASAKTVEKLLRTRDQTREMLREGWRHGNVHQWTNGRVSTEEIIDIEVDLIQRCRSRTYIDDPAVFTSDIDRFIRVKRMLSNEDMVMD